MTAYTSTDGDDLVDVTLEAIGADEPVQLRIQRKDKVEYVVGLLDGAFRGSDGVRTTLSFRHTTIVVEDGDAWDIVVHEEAGPSWSSQPQHMLRLRYPVGPGTPHTGRIPFVAYDSATIPFPRVMALRWKDGKPDAWEEANIYQRVTEDSYLVRYHDGQERGVLAKEIRADQTMWARLVLMPIDTTIHNLNTDSH